MKSGIQDLYEEPIEPDFVDTSESDPEASWWQGCGASPRKAVARATADAKAGHAAAGANG
ncbi:MAG: hypothetical protein JRN73_09220 [Nitrososphaerota archaeon]|nr:hypothetical protein [Nitrososphaerota archaeon]